MVVVSRLIVPWSPHTVSSLIVCLPAGSSPTLSEGDVIAYHSFSLSAALGHLTNGRIVGPRLHSGAAACAIATQISFDACLPVAVRARAYREHCGHGTCVACIGCRLSSVCLPCVPAWSHQACVMFTRLHMLLGPPSSCLRGVFDNYEQTYVKQNMVSGKYEQRSEDALLHLRCPSWLQGSWVLGVSVLQDSTEGLRNLPADVANCTNLQHAVDMSVLAVQYFRPILDFSGW